MEHTLAEWLHTHELSKYLETLVSNDIDTIELVKSLSTDDLKEMGVSLGDRKRFEKAFQFTYSDFEKDVISHYPYVIAYPFKRMLDEEDGRNRLELMAYSFLNLMKYMGLVLASEYFHAPLRSKELNELFRNNLYQPSFGNWNAFVREAITILSANKLSWVFPEMVQAYQTVEIKNPKKYTFESEYTDEDGRLKLRKSELTAIGALINFRNRHLGHGMPLSKEEYAGHFTAIYPVFTDLLNAFVCLKDMHMIKSDRLNSYLLKGDMVQVDENLQQVKEDAIWIQNGSGNKLPLIPFYIIPGKFNAGHTDKTQVLVYEQNTGQRMVFYSPESIKAEATGEILERLQLLLDNKEKEEPYSVDNFNEAVFQERLRLHNSKTLTGLKKEKKVIEDIYQSRGDAEMALIGWSGAQAGFFFLAAEAGSGKTNLLVHVRERYEAMGYPALLLRANRMEHTDLHSELCVVLNIQQGSDLGEYGITGTREKPFMILVDGANEHRAPQELLESAVSLAEAYPGGGLKIVMSWRVNHLDQVPSASFGMDATLFRAGEQQHANPLAANAFVLKPMNLVEMEGAWKTYANHVSKQYKPQFGFDDLLLADKPLVDQLSNPLLLRICMEIFHNKGLKSKPKGFTNLWKLWWKQMQTEPRESEYLLQLAKLLAESGLLQMPLDRLFDHPELSKAVNNLQVDSPHQQLLRKGVISQFFHEGILQVTFTMEAAYHYVLSVSIPEEGLGEMVKKNAFWEGPVKYKLWDTVYDADSSLLFDLIDEDGFPNTLTGFALAQYVLLHGPAMALQQLLSNSSGHDVEVLNMALKELEANRPKEHLLLANAVLKQAEELSSDAGISLLASLLPYGDKPIADGVYSQFIQQSECKSEDDLRALAAYHEKYGRNREALALLEQATGNNEEGNQVNAEGQAELFRLMAEQWMELGQYDKAMDLVDQSQALSASYGLLTPEKEAMLCTTRGELFGHKSFYAQTLSAYQTAHDLYQKSFGPFHKLTLKAVFRLSQTYMQLGKYDQSIQLAELGKQMTARSLGESNPTYSDFIQLIGDLFNEKGLYDDALKQYTKALEIEIEYFGESHPYISGSYTRIGDIWDTKGDYDKALDYFERSMAIDLQYYGESHPNVATSLNRIGDIWETKGDYDKAFECYERSKAINLQYYGESHPNVGASLDRLGDIWDTKGDYDRALYYFERSMAIDLQYYGESHPNVATSLNRIGGIWKTKGKYDKALDYFERSMAIRLEYYGESHPEVGVSLDRIGGIWKTKGEYDKALDYFERSMAIDIQYYGESHPNVATSLNRIGGILETKGDYDKALDYFERSMAIDLQYYGESHPEVGVSLDRIGDIWNSKGDYDKALDYFERSMAIDLQYYGESHPNVATSLNRIGGIWNTKGDYDKALDYFERSMAIRLEYYGESHPNVATSLNRIGGIWKTKGEYDKALDYFERSMAIRLEYYGESHPNVATSLNRIGGIWKTKGEYDKALDYFERSMAIRLEYYGESHPNVSTSLVSIGDIWDTKGDYDKALDYFERSMAIDLQYYGESHPEVGVSLDRIGGIWKTMGDYDKALDYFERSMAIDLQYYGESHPNVATSLNHIGGILETKGEYDKALDYFERSMAIRLECYGESHPNVATSLNHIGGILETKGEYDKALDYFERSMAIDLQYYGESHPNVATSLNRIGDIWETKGDYDKAFECYERSKAINLQYYGESHPNVGASLDRIGDIWDTKGDYDRALYYFERSMAIDLQYYGESHPNVATSLNRIGGIWKTKGDYDKALDYFERSMAIRLEYYGESHPEVGVSLDRIGGIWKTKGEYDKALDYFERSMAIDIQYYGQSHPNVGWSKGRIGEVHQKKNQLQKAYECFSSSLLIIESTYGKGSRDAAKLKLRLGYVMVLMGSIDEGMLLIRQSIDGLMASGLEKDESLARAYMNLATGHRLNQSNDLAHEAIAKAIDIFQENRGDFHVDTAEAYLEYAQLLLATGDTVSSNTYAEKAYQIFNAKLGEHHPSTLEAQKCINQSNTKQ